MPKFCLFFFLEYFFGFLCVITVGCSWSSVHNQIPVYHQFGLQQHESTDNQTERSKHNTQNRKHIQYDKYQHHSFESWYLCIQLDFDRWIARSQSSAVAKETSILTFKNQRSIWHTSSLKSLRSAESESSYHVPAGLYSAHSRSAGRRDNGWLQRDHAPKSPPPHPLCHLAMKKTTWEKRDRSKIKSINTLYWLFRVFVTYKRKLIEKKFICDDWEDIRSKETKRFWYRFEQSWNKIWPRPLAGNPFQAANKTSVHSTSASRTLPKDNCSNEESGK